jgi:hypothetical protein
MTKSKEIKVVKNDQPVSVGLVDIITNLVQRPDLDPDRVEKFLELQIKMEDRQAKKSLLSALSKFQGECPIINQTARSHTSSYAPLDEMVYTIKPYLAKYGLSYTYDTKRNSPTTTIMTTTVQHKEGGSYQTEHEFITSEAGGKMGDAQRLKSAITYARRASLELALGVVTQAEDDDGKRASEKSISIDQQTKIESLLEVTDTKEVDFLKFFKVESVDALDFNGASKALLMLRSKRNNLVNNEKGSL